MIGLQGIFLFALLEQALYFIQFAIQQFKILSVVTHVRDILKEAEVKLLIGLTPFTYISTKEYREFEGYAANISLKITTVRSSSLKSFKVIVELFEVVIHSS